MKPIIVEVLPKLYCPILIEFNEDDAAIIDILEEETLFVEID